MSLLFRQSGLFSSLQDEGRYSGITHGIPISGAMDLNLYRYVNMVLENPINSSSIEFYHQGLEVEFKHPSLVCVGVLDAKIQLNNEKVDPLQVLKVRAGDCLKVIEMAKGNWGYVAVKGGFEAESYFDSQSFYEPLTQKRFHNGDSLAYKSFEGDKTKSMSDFNFEYYRPDVLKVFKGPEFSKLSRTLEYQLNHASFTLSSSMDRMAFQIQEKLENELEEILTGPVLPGTIQYTSGGKMIVLMRDAQVTGGYPRILQLSESAINILSQMRAKSKFRFKLSEINSEKI